MIGLAISAYLLIQKLNGTISSIKGCGGASGCANVLGSKWSQWFSIPVSAFSTVLYLGIIGLTFKPQRTALITVVLLLVGAAIWFSLVQLLIIKAFCPWCLGTHLTGVLCAISIWRALPSEPSGKGVAPALLPAGLGLAILIIGQAIGPEPKGYAISKETLSGGVPVPENSGERIINMGTGPSFPCLLDRPARIISRNPQDSLHPSPLWPEQAKEKIALIIGEEKLNAALNDPEVNRLLASNTNDFKQLNSRTVKMPKLLIGKGKMLQGLMKNSDAFISAMEKTLPLK
jgi:uncharacterized membrane protein